MLIQKIPAFSSLDGKVLEHFADRQAVIHKGVSPCSEQFRKLPRYVAEFLCSKYIDITRPAEGITTAPGGSEAISTTACSMSITSRAVPRN